MFDQCGQYEAQCDELVTSLRKLIQMAPQGHGKLTQAQELEEELRLERDTWRLVTSLYQDRLNSADLQDSEMESEEMWSGLDDASSEEDLVKQLYEKNTTIRQAQLVVDWLERRAADVHYDTHYSQVQQIQIASCLATFLKTFSSSRSFTETLWPAGKTRSTRSSTKSAAWARRWTSKNSSLRWIPMRPTGSKADDSIRWIKKTKCVSFAPYSLACAAANWKRPSSCASGPASLSAPPCSRGGNYFTIQT